MRHLEPSRYHQRQAARLMKHQRREQAKVLLFGWVHANDATLRRKYSEVAALVGVNERTIRRWRKMPDFVEAAASAWAAQWACLIKWREVEALRVSRRRWRGLAR